MICFVLFCLFTRLLVSCTRNDLITTFLPLWCCFRQQKVCKQRSCKPKIKRQKKIQTFSSKKNPRTIKKITDFCPAFFSREIEKLSVVFDFMLLCSVFFYFIFYFSDLYFFPWLFYSYDKDKVKNLDLVIPGLATCTYIHIYRYI